MKLGDVNDDGSIDVIDVNVVIDVIVGAETSPGRIFLADLNDDGVVNVADATILINIILGGGGSSPLVAGPTMLSVSEGDLASAGIGKLSYWEIIDDPNAVSISKEDVESIGIGSLGIRTTMTLPIFVIQLFIGFDSNDLEMEIPELGGQLGTMRLASNVVGDEIRLVMYNLSGNTVKLQGNDFLKIPASLKNGKGKEIELAVKEALFVVVPEGKVGLDLGPVGKTGLSEGLNVQKTLSLNQNYPNPLNPSTTIRFELAEKDGLQTIPTTLRIYDVRGRLLRTLIDENLSPGFHSVHWDGSDVDGKKVSSGTYFYTITAGEFRETKKMIILK